jgi:hypothetical protein
MSYEIVKNIRIVPNPENKQEYIAIVKAACNNVTPRYYQTYSYCKGCGMSKAEVTKEVLYDFWAGNFAGGQSNYNKFIKSIGRFDDIPSTEPFKEYLRISKVYAEVINRLWALRNRDKHNPRVKEYSDLSERLDKKMKTVMKDTLYKLFTDKSMQGYKQKNIKPFVVIDKVSGDFVYKVAKRTYYHGYRKHVFTSARIYNTVIQYPDIFLVEEYVPIGE